MRERLQNKNVSVLHSLRALAFSISCALFFGASPTSSLGVCPAYFKLLNDVNPIHPIQTARVLKTRRDPSPDNQRQRRLIGRTRFTGNPDELLATIESMAVTPYGNLLRDKFGSHYLVQESSGRFFITDEKGRTADVGTVDWHYPLTRKSIPILPTTLSDTALAGNLVQARERHANDAKGLWATTTFVPRLLFFPYAVVWGATVSASEKLSKTKQSDRTPFVLRNLAAGVGYALLYASGLHPAQLAMDDLFSDEGQNILIDDFIEESDKQTGERPEGTVLVINAMPKKDYLGNSGKMLFDRLYANEPDARLVDANDVAEIVKEILSNENKTGKKIARMEPLGHGNLMRAFGKDSIGPLTVMYLGNDRLTLDPATAEEMMEWNRMINEYLVKQGSIPNIEPKRGETEGTQMRTVSFDSIPDLSTAFTEGAQLRFLSCNVAKEKCGKAFLAAWGDRTVKPKGGSISAATIPIAVPAEDIPLDKRTEIFEDRRNYREQVAEWAKKRATRQYASQEFARHAIVPMVILMYPGFKAYDWWRYEEPVLVIKYPKPKTDSGK